MTNHLSAAIKRGTLSWRLAWRHGGVLERAFVLGTLLLFPLGLSPVLILVWPSMPGVFPHVIGTFLLGFLTWSFVWFSAMESAPVCRAIAEAGLTRGPAHREFVLRKAEYLEEFGWRGMLPVDAVAGTLAWVEVAALAALVFAVPAIGLPIDPFLRIIGGVGLIGPLLVYFALGHFHSVKLGERRGFPVRELARRVHDEQAQSNSVWKT